MMHEQQPISGAPSSRPQTPGTVASSTVLPLASPRWAMLLPLFLAYAGFIGLGVVSTRLGVTWTAMRTTFGLPIDAISALLIAQLIGSVVVSANSGMLTARLNIGVMAAWSSGIIAVAMLGSGFTSSWGVLVALSLLTGIGTGLIEASLNTYAATYFSPRAMNWLHASFGVGSTLGLALMTAVVAGSVGWRLGFVIAGVFEVLLAVCFACTFNYWQRPAPVQLHSSRGHSTPLIETLRKPVVWIAILLFVAFTGTQAGAGQWFYNLLTEERGVSEALAGTWVSLFWASLTVGRIGIGFVVQRAPLSQILRLCMVGVLISTIGFYLNLAPWLNFASIALLGLAMAPVFPLLTSATPRYMGTEHAANGVGLQVAAAGLGGVLITSSLGVLGQSFGIATIAPALVVCAIAVMVLYELLARHLKA